MDLVVPVDEGLNPFPSLLQASKALGRKGRTIFQCSEQGLGVGIIVAYPWSAVGSGNSQFFQRGLEGRRFHRASVVRVKDKGLMVSSNTLFETGPLDESLGMFTRFIFPDLPSYDEAAKDIDDKVQTMPFATDFRWQPADVPGPQLVRTGGPVGCRTMVCSPRHSSPVMKLVVLPQDSIKTGFGGKINAFVR